MAMIGMDQDASASDLGSGFGGRTPRGVSPSYGYGNGVTQPLGPISGSASSAYATSGVNPPAAPQPYSATSPNPSSPYMPGSGYAFTGNNTVTNAQGQTGGVSYNPQAGWSFNPNTANGATSNQNAKDALMGLLNSGMDPQQAIAQINQQYGLGTGQGGQYYAPGSKGQGSGAVIGLAGYGGYYAQNPDGSWGWVPSAEQGSENIGGGPGQMGAGGSAASAYNPSASVFDDPATKPFIDLLNSRIQTLMGPAYTPQQMDLMNTQAFDPLMSARDTQRQNILNWGAQHGMGPNDGPVRQLLNQNDLQYQKIGTQAQGQVALNAINQQNQNQNLAVSLASIIPNMAWSRLTGAGNSISSINPASLLSQLGSFQNTGAQQGANFSSQLMQVLPYLMQMFGG